MRKLYRVSFEFSLLVAAESEREAVSIAKSEAGRGAYEAETASALASPVDDEAQLTRDEAGALAYGDHHEDLTCAQVIAMAKGGA